MRFIIKHWLSLLFSIFSIVISDAQNKLKFEAKIANVGLDLNIPEGFTETDIIENRDQYYDFAVINKELKVEIRYRVWEYDSTLKEIDKSLPQYKKGQMWAIVRNMTFGKHESFTEFPWDAVKQEFGADWGATESVELDCEFGKGYKYCTITALHKDTVADVYIFYLCDDLQMFMEKMNELNNYWFFSLKFKSRSDYVEKRYKAFEKEPYEGFDDFRIYLNGKILTIRQVNNKIFDATLLITDFMGKKIIEERLEPSVSEYDNLPLGRYNVTINYGENKIKRIIEIE